MKTFTKRLAMLLAVVMILGVFLTACEKKPNEDEQTSDSRGTNTETESSTSQNGGSETETQEQPESSETEAGNETETEYPEILNYEGSRNVEYADYIKDNVASGYADGERSSVFINNMNTSLTLGINGNLKNTGISNQVTAIKSANGGVYASDTMDVFVKTTSGKTYFASDWLIAPYYNILQGGYYYQEVRIAGQGFGDLDATMKKAVDIDLSTFKATNDNVGNVTLGNDGILSYTVDSLTDPGIATSVSLRDLNILSKDYNALLITMKTKDAWYAQVYVKTHNMSNYSDSCSKKIAIIPGDDFHTYIVRLDDLSNYKGLIEGIRIDVGGAISGENNQIQSVKVVNIDEYSVPVRLDRGFHVYSDKLHQELHFVTTAKTNNIASYGMKTELAADTVAKIIVKDASGTHTTLDGVDWDSAEYIGFDIKNVGIFGYILANDGESGTIKVTLENGKYTIIQEVVLPDGTVMDNKAHFYMGHRIYTDTNHTFTKFLEEAYIERNPLTEENITVKFDTLNSAKYVGYNYLRGAYEVSLKGTDFNSAYYKIWNRHFSAAITINGDDYNRHLYLYTMPKTGSLECAVVLNDDDLMLPVPLQVIKNFANDGEESIFISDSSYSAVIMPIVADKESEQSFNILHLFQNWGKYPLKQLSWIQYGTPYYHLSTGVTETNCIMPMYAGGPAWQMTNDSASGKIDEFYMFSGKTLYTLPDFRAMSGKLWTDQPQHNSCMDASWLEYYTSEGKWIASECVDDKIDSYGPIYADITLDYISDDSKIQASYRHVEMPQTDENRTYYTIRYDVTDSVEIGNFKEDFNILETNSRFGPYGKFGYLDENNNSVIEDVDKTGAHRYITLGDEYPYFDYFYYFYDANGRMCNYAVIIRDWDIVIGGEKYEDNLVIEEWYQDNLNFTRLTLDIGEVTLREGDYIDIDLILLPWGLANAENDDNVRNVRQDTCVDPYKVEASVGNVIEDDFIPKVMAENNTAEFTFSGGNNNGVVRVYGFDILTRPTIMEFVDGKWVEYDTSSISVPDNNQNAHYYDGYCVHYDGNGLYSYSFVIPTDNGAERSFKITAEEFKGYPEDPSPSIADPEIIEDSDNSEALVDPDEARPSGEGSPKLYFSAQDLYLSATDDSITKVNLDVASLKRENGVKFARYLTYGVENAEAFIVLYKDASTAIPAAPYLAIKYRSKISDASVEIWANSNNADWGSKAYFSINGDNEWHYEIIELSQLASGSFNGKQLYMFRLDFLNAVPSIPANSYIDIAYIAFFDSESEAGRFEYGDDYRTKEQIKQDNYSLCVDPESGYSISDAVFGNNIDYINGNKITFSDGNSKDGVSVINFNGNTLEGGVISIAGWTVVDGGVEKYIWSADGGKAWYKTGLYLINSIGNGAGTAHYNLISQKIGGCTFSQDSNLNSTYQSSGLGGIAVNLSDYYGKTVDVVFAAVPKNDPQTICPLILLKNVNVIGSSDSPEPDELLDKVKTDAEIKAENNSGCIDPVSGYTESTLSYGINLDFINAKSPSGLAGNSRYGCTTYTEEYTTIRGSMLVFSGWAIVDGGIKNYVYSVDGGKTWSVIYADPGSEAGEAHYNVLKKTLGDVTFSEGSNVNSMFQGSQAAGENIAGLGIDLSSYSGQTVEVIFAAIPINEPNSLCLFAKLTNVKVN